MTSKHIKASQSLLPVGLTDYPSFSNYLPFQNHHTVEELINFLGHDRASICYIWGPSGSGKTHLLYASCRITPASVYIPLLDLQLQPEMLDGLESYNLVCVDDIHSVATQLHWEKRLFSLFEELKARSNRLVVSSNTPVNMLNFSIDDLRNRFSSRQVLKLQSASEKEKIEILIDRAARRGLRIDESVVHYALKRYSRDMHALVRLFYRIDSKSLEQKSKITIPFLKNFEEFDR